MLLSKKGGTMSGSRKNFRYKKNYNILTLKLWGTKNLIKEKMKKVITIFKPLNFEEKIISSCLYKVGSGAGSGLNF